MNDIIHREDVLRHYRVTDPDGTFTYCSSVIEFVESLPGTWDNRPTGTWQVTDAYPHNVYCSNCHARFAQTHWAVWEDGSLPRAFCPNCGAKMTEDDNG